MVSNGERRLSNEQWEFLKDVSDLIRYAKRTPGVKLTGGDLWRHPSCSHGSDSSAHHDRLAIDLNLFIGDKYIEDGKPWNLSKENKIARLGSLVYNLLEILRTVAVLIYPFMPAASSNMLKQLGWEMDLSRMDFDNLLKWRGLLPGSKINKGSPLFPRIEKQPQS